MLVVVQVQVTVDKVVLVVQLVTAVLEEMEVHSETLVQTVMLVLKVLLVVKVIVVLTVTLPTVHLVHLEAQALTGLADKLEEQPGIISITVTQSH